VDGEDVEMVLFRRELMQGVLADPDLVVLHLFWFILVARGCVIYMFVVVVHLLPDEHGDSMVAGMSALQV